MAVPGGYLDMERHCAAFMHRDLAREIVAIAVSGFTRTSSEAMSASKSAHMSLMMRLASSASAMVNWRERPIRSPQRRRNRAHVA